VVQYQVARMVMNSRPPRMPETVMRCAATVPAFSVPADDPHDDELISDAAPSRALRG